MLRRNRRKVGVRDMKLCGKMKKIYLIATAVFVLLTVAASLIFGFADDKKYDGGKEIVVSVNAYTDLVEVERVAKSEFGRGCVVRFLENHSGAEYYKYAEIYVGNREMSAEEAKAFAEKAGEKAGKVELVSVRELASAGNKNIFVKAAVAAVITLILVCGYAALRYRKMCALKSALAVACSAVFGVAAVVLAAVIFGFSAGDKFLGSIAFGGALSMIGAVMFLEDAYAVSVKNGARVELGAEECADSVAAGLAKRLLLIGGCVLAAAAVISIGAAFIGSGDVLAFTIPAAVAVLAAVYSAIILVPSLWSIEKVSK